MACPGCKVRRVPEQADKQSPTMRLLTTDGVVEVGVAEEDDRSDIGLHWNAIQHLLDTGDDDRVKDFEEVEIEGYALETDADKITRWAKQGDLDFEDIYDFS